MGIIALIVITFKIFFQKIVGLKSKWKAVLPQEFQLEWVKLLEIIKAVQTFKISRYYFGSFSLESLSGFTLHGFCDASDVAYAAVIYIVAEAQDGHKISNFMTAKTKVAPRKKTCTPRLELLACLLLANLIANVIKALEGVIQILRHVCWSDSLDALYWIKNTRKRRKVFVQNRADKIRSKTKGWRHVPTDVNPADFVSRGVKSARVVKPEFEKWIEGPQLLKLKEEQWPEDLSSDADTQDREINDTTDITVNCTYETGVEVICLHVTDDVTKKPVQKVQVFQGRGKIDEVINAERYSYY